MAIATWVTNSAGPGVDGGGLYLSMIVSSLVRTSSFHNNPLPGMQCGRALGMDVGLDGCTANLEYHGFVHSDRSTRIYFGPMTADVQFQKTGAQTGEMRLTIFTPKARSFCRGRC